MRPIGSQTIFPACFKCRVTYGHMCHIEVLVQRYIETYMSHMVCNDQNLTFEECYTTVLFCKLPISYFDPNDSFNTKIRAELTPTAQHGTDTRACSDAGYLN